MPDERSSEDFSIQSTAVPTRRKMLGNLAAAGAVLGLNASGAAAATTKKTAETQAPTPPPAPEALFAMARLRDYKCRRSSSWDRTGGNADFLPLEPGDNHAA